MPAGHGGCHMRLIIAALLPVALLCVVGEVTAQVRVKGYFKKDGTYVAPHVRSSPNATTSDNYSTKGNYNPYTEAEGTPSDRRPAYLLPPLPRMPAYYQYKPALATESQIDERRRKINELASNLQSIDPMYEIRMAELMTNRLPKLQAAVGGLPLSDALRLIEREYWSIPATNQGIGDDSPVYASIGLTNTYAASSSNECRKAEQTRQALESATEDLLTCATRRDFSNDCHRPAREVRYAAENYELAVSSAGYSCD